MPFVFSQTIFAAMHTFSASRTVLLVYVLCLFTACGGSEKPSASETGSSEVAKPMPPAPSEPAFKKEGLLAFVSAKGDTIQKIEIEIASNDAERTQGMMYRTAMDEKTGMLFIFDRPEMQSFWMKNTPTSLDIIFLAPDMTILNIHKFTQPYAETNYPSTALSNLVLEVKGGYCQKNGIKPGDKIAYTLLYQ